MKKVCFLMVAVLLCAVSCSDNVEGGDPQNAPAEPNVSVDSKVMVCELDADSTKAHFSFNADRDWEIVCLNQDGSVANWIHPSSSHGRAGQHSIDLKIETNNGVDNRFVTIEVLESQGEVSRADDMESLVAKVHATLFTFSLVQYGYYELKYGDAIEFTVNSDVRLQTLVNNYIVEHNCNYSDMEYLELFGPINADDFQFMREYLTNLTVLDLTAADIAEIPAAACANMKSLHYVKLPFKLKKIHQDAFCATGLKNINMVMPPLVNFVGSNAFADTNIAGAIIFLGTTSQVSLDMGAFYGNGESITSAIFCEGITRIGISISGAFGDSAAIVMLPSTLAYVGCGITQGVSLIYCYATTPPKVDDNFGLSGRLRGMFVPRLDIYANLGAYEDGGCPWSYYYHENNKYNRLWGGLR